LWLRGLLLCGLLLILLYLAAPRLYAATVIVTTTSDSGPGSLRQAIADAAPGDTITFAADLSGQTILLRTTLTLTKDVTLTGSTIATPITLSGNRTVRVLAVESGVNATLSALIIADGRSDQGGGLYNQGRTTLDHLHFTRNRAANGGGIYNLQQLIIDNSTFSTNRAPEDAWLFSDGGGIANRGYLQVSNSRFDKNEAASGGAIGSTTSLTITQSSFHQNRAIYGGAINAGGNNTLLVNASVFIGNQAHQFGGAITTHITTTIRSSTFRENRATLGSAIRYFNNMTVFNSTFSANRGSVLTNSGSMFSFGALSIYNSTVVGNEAPYGAVAAYDGFQLYNSIIAHNQGRDCVVTPVPNINSLISDSSCTAALTGDPRLGPLQPANDDRQAYLLLPDSPAIDAGDNATCQADDQHGAPRPVDGNGDGIAACDIGAVERQPITANAEIYLQGNQHWISNGANLPDRANHTDFGQTNQPYASLTRTFVIS
jgi:predicted outer membrane repeat protein